jgi:hypothetical protein
VIVVSNTTPLNYLVLLDYERMRDRLVGETTFYVTEDVLRESEHRFWTGKLAQEQQAQE